MKPTNLTIKDLFNDKAKLTFLVGAGCSVDPPSCLPAGRSMMKAIINYTCAESEIEKILELEELRFEQLVGILRDTLDPKLKIIDYYGQCDKPNFQHFFLADLITKGHFVMTTNFDFLIEYALLQSKVSKKEIIPIITKQDFENYSNPNELFKNGKKTLYKIHGSTKNLITGEDTKDSLVATIQALGLNKEGLNVFQIQPFQREAFNNISRDRSLVVIGYSGSDDFDVIPTLLILKNLKSIIWIKYVRNDGGKELVYEINSDTTDNTDKINQILKEIKRANNAEHVYRVDANTTRLINTIIEIKPKKDTEVFSLNPYDWLKTNIRPSNNFWKNQICYGIYNTLDKYNDALRCSREILKLAKDIEDQQWMALALGNISEIYDAQGNFSEALKYCQKSLKIHEKLSLEGDKLSFRRIATSLNNMGKLYKSLGKYSEALKYLKEALKIDEKLENFSGKAPTLNNMGLIYFEQTKYLGALKFYSAALKIYEKLGDLSGKAVVLNNIGGVHIVQKNYSKALKINKLVLNLTDQLRDLSGHATCLNNLGFIYYTRKNFQRALKSCKESLKIAGYIGDKFDQAVGNDLIGQIYDKMNKKYDSLKHLGRALALYLELGMKDKVKEMQSNINKIKGIEIPQDENINIIPLKKPKKVGRNEPCPCGSGVKYKKCCGKMIN